MSSRPHHVFVRWPLAVGIALIPAWATAQADRSIEDGLLRLEIKDCAALFPAAEVERILAFERPVRAPGVSVHAAITCTGTGVTMSVAGPGLAGISERQGDIASSAPETRARLVALGLAELIALAPASMPSDEPIDDEPQQPNLIAHTPQVPSTTPIALSLAGGLGGFTSGLANLRTGAVRLLGPLRSGIAGLVGFDIARADRAARLGTVDAWLISLTLAPAWVAGKGGWRAVGALGIRAGHAWMKGRSEAGGVVTGALSGAFFGPELELSASLAVLPRLFVVASASAGYVVRPVRGRIEGEEHFAVEGFWGMARLGVGITMNPSRSR